MLEEKEVIESTVEATETQNAGPKNLDELSDYIDGRLKEVQDTYAIIAMSTNDLVAQVNRLDSVKRLKRFTLNLIAKNKELDKQLAIYAIDALSIAKKTVEVVQSKDPRNQKDETSTTEESEA